MMLGQKLHRRVVPRWRTSWVTAQTVEAQTKPPKSTPDFSLEVESKKLEFERGPTVPVASELMYLAVQAKNSDLAQLAARLIIEHSDVLTSSSLLSSAKSVLGIELQKEPLQEQENFVKTARKLLSLDYNNPILLTDVARELTALGHERSANRYIRSAISLAPNNRFVVRSAARFFLHIGDKDQAHDLLKRSPLIAWDPWIQASEIAVATVRDRTSLNVKKAIQFLSSEVPIGIQHTELASAVATVELLSGSDKKARQLFQKALKTPNENSLAQIEWASSKLKLAIDEVALRTPLSFEANSNNAYRKLNISDSIGFAKQWAADEPFASRPFDALCYLYSIDGRYTDAFEAAKHSIKVDGGEASFGSRLNLLFAKIQCGDIDNAYEEFMHLAKDPQSKNHSVHMLANAGALAYVAGDIELGRDFYQRSIKQTRSNGDFVSEALARAFFARAAKLHEDPQSISIIDEAAKRIAEIPNPGATHIVKTLVDENLQKLLKDRVISRVAKKKLQWDAATNTLKLLG